MRTALSRAAGESPDATVKRSMRTAAAFAACLATAFPISAAAAQQHSKAAEQDAPSYEARIVSSISSKDEVFITIDDGWFPDKRVLELLRKDKVPTTAFVIGEAMEEHKEFWAEYSKIGSIQDHTLSHPFLTRLSFKNGRYQIETDKVMISRLIGTAPYMMRPPYGAHDKMVSAEAGSAGMKYMVLWDAEVPMNSKGYIGERFSIKTKDGKKLGPGDIILMHWDPGLYNKMELLLKKIKDSGLKVGSLQQQLRD